MGSMVLLLWDSFCCGVVLIVVRLFLLLWGCSCCFGIVVVELLLLF